VGQKRFVILAVGGVLAMALTIHRSSTEQEAGRSATPATSGPSGDERKGSVFPFLFSVFFASRLFFFAVGTVAASLLPHLLSSAPYREDVSGFDVWGRWDGARYLTIATSGYSLDPQNAAFFPLYPLLIRFLLALFGSFASPVLWGALVSLVASAFAFYFIFEVARELYDERVARIAILCFAFFPTALFLNAVYTEGLFIALSAGSFWAARVKRNFLLGCVLAALAAATRNLGFLLVIPLALEWRRGRLGWRGAYLALVPSGLVAYMAYLWLRFSDPLLFYHAQAEWGRSLGSPKDTAAAAVSQAYSGFGRLLDPGRLFFDQIHEAPARGAQAAVYFVVFALFVFLLVAGVRTLPKGLWLYSLLLLAVPEISPDYHHVMKSAGASRWKLSRCSSSRGTCFRR
jgi:hypothetical protein